MRSDSLQFRFDRITDIKRIDKIGNAFRIHLAVCTCQRLQCLVGFLISLTAKNRLNSFSHYVPHIIKIAVDCILIKQQLMQAFQRALNRYHSVCQRYAYIAQHGRIGQVALQSRYRQLSGKMQEDGVRYSKVAFGILEIYRVHLVRHCR